MLKRQRGASQEACWLRPLDSTGLSVRFQFWPLLFKITLDRCDYVPKNLRGEHRRDCVWLWGGEGVSLSFSLSLSLSLSFASAGACNKLEKKKE